MIMPIYLLQRKKFAFIEHHFLFQIYVEKCKEFFSDLVVDEFHKIFSVYSKITNLESTVARFKETYFLYSFSNSDKLQVAECKLSNNQL